MAKKEIIKSIVSFQFKPSLAQPGPASLDIIVFLADCLVTAELDS